MFFIVYFSIGFLLSNLFFIVLSEERLNDIMENPNNFDRIVFFILIMVFWPLGFIGTALYGIGYIMVQWIDLVRKFKNQIPKLKEFIKLQIEKQKKYNTGKS